MKIPNILKSSANPEKLSLTLKSFIPLVLSLGIIFGFDISQESILEIITAITGIVSGVYFLYGIGRKIYYKFK